MNKIMYQGEYITFLTLKVSDITHLKSYSRYKSEYTDSNFFFTRAYESLRWSEGIVESYKNNGFRVIIRHK